MKRKMKSLYKKVETTMACVAYAEAGEDCPLDEERNEHNELVRCKMSEKDALACSAYAEAGVPCPVCGGA